MWGEAVNLPFAPRRGRVQAKRRTQGMHETSPPAFAPHHRPHTLPLDAQGGIKGGLDRSTIVGGQGVAVIFGHPLRASHASPSRGEGEGTPLPATFAKPTEHNERTTRCGARRQTSPSRSEGDACKRSAARRGCTKHHHLPKPPLIPPLHTKAEGKNLPFAPRRGRVQAKRRTQGMHETSPPPQTPINSPLHTKAEGKNLPFAPRRGRVQAKRRTQGMHETSPPPQTPINSTFAHQGGGKKPPLRGAKGTRASEAPHAGDARNSPPS